MKRLLTAALLALSSSVFAATLNPIQLLNPAGSTAGQAIVSTGASTPPAWSKVAATALAAQAANTVVANVTASSASPTAVAMPSCSTTTSALQYTSGTGFTCLATSANTVGSTYTGNLTFNYVGATNTRGLIWTNTGVNRWSMTNDGTAESGSNTGSNFALNSFSDAGSFINSPLVVNRASGAVSFSGLITPNSAIGVKGTATNDSAQAGSIGEFVSSAVGATGLTAGTPANLTSISLTAGDWDVTGSARFSPAGTTTVSTISVAVNTTSATLGGPGTTTTLNSSLTTGQPQILNAPTLRLSIASTTTIFLVVNSGFAVSTLTSDGIIRARRVR
ncbi:hypothetical protein [Paraburkholderia sp. BL17N1]|uniref:hypothetical protein n=1 Tax=Paraburkholderia sp. BL17N1 TaxID=1938798 RepID=UPI000EAF624C|nr:hypothetical protein [Paraburkholderia sp. BL17N1]RKR42652.1 hypothetical protein B0G82_0194 [Paraburkholderia sp. BL17N1]